MLGGKRSRDGDGRGGRFEQVQPVVAYASAHLHEDLSLGVLAGEAGLSAFHLHRVFSAALGETPKQLTSRLRLERAAAMLLATDRSILDVALSCGFQSHEVFLRAFRRRHGMTPRAYRRRGFVPRVDARQAGDHAALVSRVGPCVGLFHFSKHEGTAMTYSIMIKELSPQPVLVVRRRVKWSEIGAALGEMLPAVFLHAQQTGTALAGQPFARYLDCGPGLLTLEAGLAIAAPEGSSQAAAAGPTGGAEVEAGTLPGGPVATTTHLGPYEKLRDAHAAIEQWIEAQGLAIAGPAWESYVTDPADYPDPGDWKTDVFIPLAR